MFSVLAGVLLLVNLFVMLAEERKAELGMLRAVGLRRNHLMRAFGLEGACYGLVAAILGAVAGVGVGAAIVVVTRGIFSGDASGNVTLRFAATPFERAHRRVHRPADLAGHGLRDERADRPAQRDRGHPRPSRPVHRPAGGGWSGSFGIAGTAARLPPARRSASRAPSRC